jgi:hypothetical protein
MIFCPQFEFGHNGDTQTVQQQLDERIDVELMRDGERKNRHYRGQRSL